MLIFGIVANAAVLRPVPYVFSVITKHSSNSSGGGGSGNGSSNRSSEFHYKLSRIHWQAVPPSVYSRITISPIPFLALATHKLNDVTYMWKQPLWDTVLRKQRRKRKNEKRTHMHLLHPFLAVSIPKIMYYGPLWLCVL